MAAAMAGDKSSEGLGATLGRGSSLGACMSTVDGAGTLSRDAALGWIFGDGKGASARGFTKGAADPTPGIGTGIEAARKHAINCLTQTELGW